MAKLKDLLISKGVATDLDSLHDLAKLASHPHRHGDYYTPIARPHIDGFEIRVVAVSKEIVKSSKIVLKNAI